MMSEKKIRMGIHFRLSNLGYTEDISEEVFTGGAFDNKFINVIAWLNSELINFFKLESFVDCDTKDENSLSFYVEVSSLLKELSCPYKCLTIGNIAERFILPKNKRLLIAYLCTELEAAKIQVFKYPKKKIVPIKVELDESKTAKELKNILDCLHLKWPEIITTQQIFTVIEKKLKDISKLSTPKEKVGALLFKGCLTENQWFHLECLYKEMYQEYKVRRNLLLTRLDVTVKSFTWSERLKSRFEEIMAIYEKKKSGILLEPMVNVSDILASKPNLAFIDKTSSAVVRINTKSSVNNILIGDVPDRGGRPEDQKRPPPEVPSWQKKDSSFNKRAADNPSRSKDLKGSSRGSFAPGIHQLAYQPVYNSAHESVYHNTQLGNPQFGFGGYIHAGNNYQHYGIGDNQVKKRSHYQTRALSRGSFSSKRDGHGHSYRGSN